MSAPDGGAALPAPADDSVLSGAKPKLHWLTAAFLDPALVRAFRAEPDRDELEVKGVGRVRAWLLMPRRRAS